MSAFWGPWPVYDSDLVSNLCQKIQQENDPQKITELLSLLRTVQDDEREAARLKLKYLVTKRAVSESKAAD